MNYHRLEVNLLPPELQPGPAVRYALIFNILLISATVAYLALDSFYGWTMLMYARQENEQLTSQVQAGAQIISDYDRLLGIENKITNYGRLIGLASADYIDIPVVLDRLAKVLPDGVYLERVTTDSGTTSPGTLTVIFSLRSSRRDTDLVLRTLRAFKQDNVFYNCFMPSLNVDEQPLNDLLSANGVTWTATGPEIGDTMLAEEFSFEIRAVLQRNFEGVTLPVLQDDSSYFEGFTLAAASAAPAAGAAPAQQPAAGQPAAPPPGVEVAEVH